MLIKYIENIEKIQIFKNIHICSHLVELIINNMMVQMVWQMELRLEKNTLNFFKLVPFIPPHTRLNHIATFDCLWYLPASVGMTIGQV